MSRDALSRRRFLTLPVAVLLAPWTTVSAEIRSRKGAYVANVGILYDLFTFRLAGTITESVDRATGQYEVTAVGDGSGIANRVESRGRFQDGRWTPARTVSWFSVRGRESRSDVIYASAPRTVEYHARSETFLLRRLRVVNDRLTVPSGQRVDDVISVMLNYADGTWAPEPDGTYRTWVVRRRKRDSEGPDDVDPNPGAELVPLELRVAPDASTGKPTALFDMTRFSSWAKRDSPARIVFGGHRRPELITTSLMLGTSVRVDLKDP